MVTGHVQPVTAIVGTFPVGTAGRDDNEIHTFDVIGPELRVSGFKVRCLTPMCPSKGGSSFTENFENTVSS